jgi:acetyltransferase-like isoleucine patch superfamily enzyme
MSENINIATSLFEVDFSGDIMIREYCTIRNSVLGDGCKIYERVSIKKSIVGSRCEINAGTYIENAMLMEDVQIGPNCSIVGVTHEFSLAKGVSKEDNFQLIVLGERSWIGAGCIILPNVAIGDGAIVAAGSIVRIDVPPYHIYRGDGKNFKCTPIR